MRARLEQVDALLPDGRFFALFTALFKPGPGLCAGPGAGLPAVDVGDAGLGITMISAMDTPGRCPGLGDMPGVSIYGRDQGARRRDLGRGGVPGKRGRVRFVPHRLPPAGTPATIYQFGGYYLLRSENRRGSEVAWWLPQEAARAVECWWMSGLGALRARAWRAECDHAAPTTSSWYSSALSTTCLGVTPLRLKSG